MFHRTTRANFLAPSPDPIFTNPILERNVLDLLALYAAIADDAFSGHCVYLNRNARSSNRDIDLASRRLVRGGIRVDADFIVDDLLIDVKTSKTKTTPSCPWRIFASRWATLPWPRSEGSTGSGG